MKIFVRPWLGLAVFTLLLSTTVCRAADGDTEWKKVEEATSTLKEPKERPKNREEAMAMLKKGLEAFDTAYTAAMKAAPMDPRRWDAAMFDAMTNSARGIVGLPERAKPPISLEEILQAPDASAEIKSQASIMDVMTSADAAVESNTTPAWIAKAEKHLKDYPGHPNNKAVEARIASLKATADLKSKPLELKFKAVDGTEVDLEKLRGKVVLVDFWATWCGPCVAELPNVLKVFKDQHANGFEIVGISLDQDKAALEAFTKEKGMAWPQYFDGKGWDNDISSKFGIQSIPAMWLLNKKGIVISTNAREILATEVPKLLAE